MGVLDGHVGWILGCANDRSIAAAIAEAAHREGAKLWLSYQDERLRDRVEAIGAHVVAERVLPCDVSDETAVLGVADALRAVHGRVDFVVHAVASARPEELNGRFVATSPEGFAFAMDVSVYSLVRVARATESLLAQSPHAPSLLTTSYLGAQRVVPNYNVMGVAKAALEATVRYLAADLGPKGIRVNALSPGPIKTLSAASIRGFRSMTKMVAEQAPLRRNVSAADVAQAALGLLCPFGAAVTGEVLYVDAGYHVLGAPRLDTQPETRSQ